MPADPLGIVASPMRGYVLASLSVLDRMRALQLQLLAEVGTRSDRDE